MMMNLKNTLQTPEAIAQRCSVKKVFLEILQNSQENTYARVSFLIKLQVWDRTRFLTEDLWPTPSETLNRTVILIII